MTAIQDKMKNIFGFGLRDNLMARVKRLEGSSPYLKGGAVLDTGKYRVVDRQLVDSDGRLILASGQVTTTGSLGPAVVNSGFSVVPSANSAHIYWDGTNSSKLVNIRRADKSRVNIPPGDLNVTGLSPTTKYWMYPYWAPSNTCSLCWALGTVGSPQFCFTAASDDGAAAQNQYDRESLGVLTFTTTSGGTGGPVGGGGSCVMLGTEIEPIGDAFLTSVHLRETQWVRIEVEDDYRSLNCTYDHPLYTMENGRTNGIDVKVGDHILMDVGAKVVKKAEPFTRVCTKVSVQLDAPTQDWNALYGPDLMKFLSESDYGHMFLANGFVSHNMKIAPE